MYRSLNCSRILHSKSLDLNPFAVRSPPGGVSTRKVVSWALYKVPNSHQYSIDLLYIKEDEEIRNSRRRFSLQKIGGSRGISKENVPR